MLPPFDLQGGAWVAGARAACVAGLLVVFGGAVFRRVVMPRVAGRLEPAGRDRIGRDLLVLTRVGAAAAVLGTVAWLVVQAASIVGAGSVGAVLAAVPVVAAQTRFGHLVLAQLAALAGVALAAGRQEGRARQAVGLGCACLALGLQAGHGHAAAMQDGPSLLLGFDLLHLAGAGAWLGGLPPLLLVVWRAPAKAAAAAARWFSPLGKLCIAALVVSAVGQSWVLVGSLVGFVGTAYGWMLFVKLALFGVLLGFAAANRYRFAPALLGDDPVAARRVLVRSIAVQSGFGLAIVLAAAVLSNLPPAMHIQAVWPFAERFSLDTVREDVDFRNEALGAALALAGAVVLLGVAALVRRRVRWLIATAALAIGWVAIPHLDLLFVPASPTAYYHSPTGFSAASILDGAALYPTHCAACHGATGHGDGPAAGALPVPPADLTAAHLWMHTDGELFWWIMHGITAPDGRQAMPGFGAVLSDDQRWDLIDYIRAHNAGLALHATGSWPAPIQAPGLQARCAGGRDIALADLHGGYVRLVIGAAHPVAGVTTIALAPPPGVQPGAGLCVADDTTLPGAYAIAGGLPEGEVPGAQFLVDGAGWLRAVQRGGTGPGWDNPQALAADIAQLQANPVAAAPASMPMNMQM